MNDLELFDAVAERLLLKQGFITSQLITRLRNITNRASEELPPVQVLYCSSHRKPDRMHGDRDESESCMKHGYSDAFQSFVHGKHDSADSLEVRCALERVEDRGLNHSRVRDVQWLAPFGQHVMEIWPGIAKLVKAYMRNGLGDQMLAIEIIQWEGKRLLEIPRILDELDAQPGRIDGVTEWSTWDLVEFGVYNIYTPSALKEMRMQLDDEESKLLISIKEKRDVVLEHMTRAQYRAMFKCLSSKFVAEEAEELELSLELTPELHRPSWELELSFIDAIAHYGEHHFAVWKNQNFFRESAMRFLLMHPEHAERLASDGNNVDGTHQLGLIAACNEYCTLEIAEMPRWSEWRVEEDDERETICLL